MNKRIRAICLSDEGTSIIELVIAASILFIASMGVITAVMFAATASAQASQRVRAMNLANQRLETARNLPYDSVGVIYDDGTTGDPPGTIPAVDTVGGYTITTDVQWAMDPTTGRATYKDMSITISWEQPRTGSISISSAIFGKSLLTNVGDLNVTVIDKDTGDPVPLMRVAVKPSGSATRTIYSGNDGTAFFGYIPSGNARITCEALGWVVDNDITLAVNVMPDLLTETVIDAYRSSRATITVLDPSNAPIANATVTMVDSPGGREQAPIKTDANGVAVFNDLLPSDWTATASFTGVSDVSGSLLISTGGSDVALTLRLASVTPPPPPPPGANVGGFTVHVTSAGAHVNGATVKVTGPNPSSVETTGSRGVTTNGELAFSNYGVGTYTLLITSAGHNDYSTTVAVIKNGNTLVEVPLVDTVTTGNADLTIRVRSSSDHDRHDYKVTVVGPNGYSADFWTPHGGDNDDHDGDSNIVVHDLPSGEYTIKPNKGAWVTVTMSGSDNSVDVQGDTK